MICNSIEICDHPACDAERIKPPDAAAPRKFGRCNLDKIYLPRGKFLSINRTEESQNESYELIVSSGPDLYFCQGGRSARVSCGEYVLLNGSHFYELSSNDNLCYWRVTIPASDLATRMSWINDHVGRRFQQNPRMAQLLLGFINMIAETFSDELPPNPEALATELVNLVVLVLAAEGGEEGLSGSNARYLLRQRIFDFVETNLGDADLSPVKIARANRISSSYLYSLFSDSRITVGQFIQTKRLQKAYELLVADAKNALTVSEVAYQVGFKNASHFSRAFSRHFHLSPKAARRSALSYGAGDRA